MSENFPSIHSPKYARLFFLLLFVAPATFAQSKGEHVITIGSCLTLANSYREVPVNAMYDYGLTDHLSLGAGYTRTALSYNRVTRHSFGIRALYHLGKPDDNLDFYFGGRLGASYWSSSVLPNGTKVDLFRSDLILFPVHVGGVTPTAQLVVGGRYLISNWIGVTAEVACGPPYFISFGLSANVGNTGNGFNMIREQYHAPLQPITKNNVVKINLSSVIGIPGVAYERHLFNRFAVEAGASYQLKGSLQAGYYESEVDVIAESDSISEGLNLYGMIKFYVSAQRHAFPQGWYVGAVYDYKRKKSTVHVVDLHPTPGTINYDYQKETEQHAGGLGMGYQHLLWNHFTFDVFAGFRYGETRMLSMQYFDPTATEENFGAYFGYHRISLEPKPNAFMLKMSVGFAF